MTQLKALSNSVRQVSFLGFGMRTSSGKVVYWLMSLCGVVLISLSATNRGAISGRGLFQSGLQRELDRKLVGL